MICDLIVWWVVLVDGLEDVVGIGRCVGEVGDVGGGIRSLTKGATIFCDLRFGYA